jgi:formylglycine-generating enzyme required for sulfatase activity
MNPIAQLAPWVFFPLLAVFADAELATAQPPKPKDGPLGMKFVGLPRGTFYRSGGPWNLGKAKLVAKKSEVNEAFEIAIHEVTQGQWQEIMGKNPSAHSRTGGFQDRVKDISDEDLKHFPVERVSWNEVQEFIKKLNNKEKDGGYTYRLPTEVEWEYACRGGATSEEECSFLFYFDKPTNDLSSLEANFAGYKPAGKAKQGPHLRRSAKVGSYPPNKLGLYDMHGNVSEWCSDAFDPKLGAYYVIRGGCLDSLGFGCSAAHRSYMVHYAHEWTIGFRLVRVSAK